MLNFNSSFNMVFLATQVSGQGTGKNANANLSNGFLITGGISTSVLKNTSATANSNYGVGSFGFFDSKTWKSVTAQDATGCCPLVLAGASLYNKDKVSDFIGGYQESQKSKIILPKLVTAFYRVDPCTAQAQVTHIGNTKYTKTLSPANSACSFDFLCGETYTLHIEARGEAALWMLNHQLYRDIDFYTGCCPTDNPTQVVDSTLVMIGWADKIVNDPELKYFYDPIVYDEDGNKYYPPGNAAGNTPTWNNYVSPGHQAGKTAGIRLAGSYVDSTFSNCTFQVSDAYHLEPVITNIELKDLTGDPCTFTGICVVNECDGVQAMGTGDAIVRQLAMSESYRQMPLANNDLRIREITLGNQLVDAVSRSRNYTRYVIRHNIPRNYNPESLYDKDQYELHIITDGTNASFETFMSTWLSNCQDCVSLETFGCTACTILTP